MLYIWVFPAHTIALCCSEHISDQANKSHLNTACVEALWGEMTAFQDHLCNDPTEGIFQPNPHTALLLSPFGCIYQPTSPVPPFLLPLNQSPKEVAGSDITNCLTHTMYAKAFKVACELCRHWRFELILSRAETSCLFKDSCLSKVEVV